MISCHRVTICTAAIAEVVYLRQYSLTEPIPLQDGFWIQSLLLDWLLPQESTVSLEWIHTFSKGICAKVNKMNLDGIWTQLADFSFQVVKRYTYICWLMRDMHKNWYISFFVALIYLIKWCFLSYAPVYIENSCFSSLLTIIYLVISPEFCYSSLYICGWMQMCISMWMWN